MFTYAAPSSLFTYTAIRHRFTHLRAGGVHCRESAGIRPHSKSQGILDINSKRVLPLQVTLLVLALSSYLGCLAPFIYVYGCLSCPTHIICGCPGLFFVFVPWVFFPLLNPSLAKMSSAGYFHARFLLSAFFSFLFFSDRVRPQFVLV